MTSLYPRRIPVTRKDGSRGYVSGSICDNCWCNSREQAACIFQKDNARGILAGFSPKPSYRKKHREDIASSPLMQQFRHRLPIDNHVALDHVLPPVKMPNFPVANSWQSMLNTLDRMKMIRRQVVG